MADPINGVRNELMVVINRIDFFPCIIPDYFFTTGRLKPLLPEDAKIGCGNEYFL